MIIRVPHPEASPVTVGGVTVTVETSPVVVS